MGNVIIKATNLEKQYGKSKVLDNVNFQVEEGMICGLIGPNGAGKTTIMKALGGLIIPSEGSIELFGKSTNKDLDESRKRISYMIETPYAKENMSAYENLEKQRIQRGIPNKDVVNKALEIVGLSNVGNKAVKKYSLGMRQRLGIANALLSKPEVMIMDEPINGLDPEGIVEIRELLIKLNKEEHITIIISSHILSELSLLCSDYIFIHDGQIKEQVSACDLQRICKKYYHIHTSNDALALTTLEQSMGIKDVSVDEDGSLLVYEQLDKLEAISKTLYENAIIPVELHVCEANLEQYYMNMVGEQNV